MRAYRNNAEQTRATLDDDGWLHTGDVARIDGDGDLTIVDRKKELIINAFGKNMSPANIEFKLQESHPIIGTAVAVGDNRRYNVALLTINAEAVPAVAKELGIDDLSVQAMAGDPRVLDLVEAAVQQANERLARVEQIKKYKILPEDWQAGGDELTPTMKLKRKAIAAKYADVIEELYRD
jgi:long-subunit acyl-CoA synthetase (AMP-forming)